MRPSYAFHEAEKATMTACAPGVIQELHVEIGISIVYTQSSADARFGTFILLIAVHKLGHKFVQSRISARKKLQ